MPTIEIANLRNIRHLRYEMPPKGVFLLCGANGAGKSTLLACLLRIGSSNAFPAFFRTSNVSSQLDQFDGAEITYTVGTRTVSYAYRGQRWAPRPRANADVLEQFGYPSVIYVGANAARIEPRPEEYTPQRVRDVSDDLRGAAVSILGSRFQNLKQINVRRGIGSEAFLLLDQTRTANDRRHRNHYFSEKNFSLGELCVLKLLRQLLLCPRGSLVLIDELELALHPSAQIALLKFLETFSATKELTVIFSTHSISLIRTARQSQLLLLYSTADGIACIPGVYPAHAVGVVASSIDSAPDRAIFVEDEFARLVVEPAVEKLVSSRFGRDLVPTVAILPIGGFKNVIQVLENAPSLLAASTQYFALLDEDVQSESIAQARQNNNHAFLQQVARVESHLRFLPWTPEVGLLRRLDIDQNECERSLRALLQDHRFSLPAHDWARYRLLSGSNARNSAKDLVSRIVSEIQRVKGWTDREAKRALAQWFARAELDDPATSAMLTAVLMPLIR